MSTIFFLVATFVFLGIFFFLYKRNRYRLVVSFVFLVSLACAALTIVFASFEYDSKNKFLEFIFAAFFVLVTVFIFFVFVFGIYLLIFLLFLNARSMIKKERRTLANSLTLLVAIGMLLFVILSWALAVANNVPTWIEVIYSGLVMVLAYFLLHILLFSLSFILCNFSNPKKNQQYIVVLGCGLVNGKVSNLLAKRIDAAIKFYKKQEKKTTPPVLLFSGGQGADEPVAEAVAMQQYALEKGIPLENTLLEPNSTNTLENMKFSKEIMKYNENEKPYKAIFATSNYHVFRSGIYARKAGIPMLGIGGKTALYYLPTALLREYLAYWWLHKKANIICSIIFFILGVSPYIVTFITNYIIR